MINLDIKELEILKYLIKLKVDTPQYNDVNQELRSALRKINLNLLILKGKLALDICLKVC